MGRRNTANALYSQRPRTHGLVPAAVTHLVGTLTAGAGAVGLTVRCNGLSETRCGPGWDAIPWEAVQAHRVWHQLGTGKQLVVLFLLRAGRQSGGGSVIAASVLSPA